MESPYCLRPGIIGTDILVKMELFEAFVRVLEKLGTLKIAVAQYSDRLGTLALVPAEELGLVSGKVVGVDGEKEACRKKSH